MGSTLDELAPGNYELSVLAENAYGKSWDTTVAAAPCTFAIDAAGGLGSTACFVDRVP